MFYTYILLSPKSHLFYIGSTKNLKTRLQLHNTGQVKATKPNIPWHLIWYCGFLTEREAKNFERYLKTGSGRAFAYKRLLSVVLAKDFSQGRKSHTKL